MSLISYDKSSANTAPGPGVFPIQHINEPCAMDYDAIDGFAYWLDCANNTIFKSQHKGSEVTKHTPAL